MTKYKDTSRFGNHALVVACVFAAWGCCCIRYEGLAQKQKDPNKSGLNFTANNNSPKAY